MCYPKPGPRCSSHLKKEIAEAEKAIAQYNKHQSSPSQYYGSVSFQEYETARTKVDDLRYQLAGTRSGQAELQSRIDAATAPTKKQALEDLKAMTKASYDEKMTEYKKVEKQLKKQKEEEAARAKAEKEAAARKARALKILQDDSAASIKAKGATIPKKPVPTVQPVARYSAASYGGKGGGKY